MSFPIGLFCLIWRQSAVVFMRPQCAAITDHIVRDRLLRRGKAWTSDFRPPFCFQTPEDSGYPTVADPPSCKRALAAASASRSVADSMRLDNLVQQRFLSLARLSVSVTPGPVAAAVHLKHPTQALHRIALFKSLDYRELLRESELHLFVVPCLIARLEACAPNTP